METLKLFKKAGEATEGFDLMFAWTVYKGCPIYHHWNFDDFYLHYLGLIQSDDHYEYIVKDGERIVASMCIVPIFDMHVQNCMSIRVAYSEDPKALTSGYRWMYQLGRDLGIDWVAYTHRTGPYSFDTQYRKVKGITNDASSVRK